MTRNQYDLDFKRMVVQKGEEIGNISAAARQHDLDPKMVLRWRKIHNKGRHRKLDWFVWYSSR